MKKSSTLFLKIAVFVLALLVLGVCFLAYAVTFGDALDEGHPTTLLAHPLLIAMYITVIPFMVALYQAFKILLYIDQKKAFSEFSIKALKNIKICAYVISGIYFLSLPLFMRFAESEDAPGVMLMGLVLVGAPLVIAVLSALLQKLVQSAMDLKAENDLTV
ncbi:MAG: DUF2975 domain-containing protein [bacterium]